jgi:hypothetical protein
VDNVNGQQQINFQVPMECIGLLSAEWWGADLVSEDGPAALPRSRMPVCPRPQRRILLVVGAELLVDVAARGLRPGQYTLRLTVDGETYTQPVTVKADPRGAPPLPLVAAAGGPRSELGESSAPGRPVLLEDSHG